ncbi:MAG TPA: hypothetical protein VGI40_24575 [Pirellulaceae bacterium]
MARFRLLAMWFALLVALMLRPALAEPPIEKAQVNAAAAETPEEPKFIRVRRDDEDRPVAMETAVVHFTSKTRPGVSIDLIGAVHIADRSYYDELNKLFEKYDVVLYELVAPEGTRIPQGGRKEKSTHPIGIMQEGMSSILELSHQLACVDYTKANLVHADMSPDEFAKSMEDRGESFIQMFLRLMGTGIAQSAAGAGGMNDADILMALFAKDRAMKLKTLMAQQFQSLEGAMSALDGPGGSAIITERNKKCFEVLDKQIAAGKKKIAVFYGAGHLPDMQKRLEADYGFHRAGESWLTAWNLKPRQKAER